MSEYITEIHVVNGWSFRDHVFPLEGNRHLVFLGPNGSGKTTILRSLNDFLVG